MEPTARQKAAMTWLCTGCGYPKPGTGAVDVRIQQSDPGNVALSFVFGNGIAIARKAFLAGLGEKVIRSDLFLGRVFGPDGNLLPNWTTYRGRRRVIIRGTKNVSYRRCSECERDVYFSMGRRYIYPPPPGDTTVLQSDLYGLVIPPELEEHLQPNNWSGLHVERLPVVAASRDGLPPLSNF